MTMAAVAVALTFRTMGAWQVEADPSRWHKPSFSVEIGGAFGGLLMLVLISFGILARVSISEYSNRRNP
jgi:hypothetical protein